MHAQPSQTQHTACPGVPHTHARDLRDGSRPHAHSSTRSSLGSTPLNAWPMRTRNTVSVELMPVPHSRGLANVKVTGNTAAIMGHPFFFSTKLTSPAIHGGAHDYGARARPCAFADTGEARTYIQGTQGHTMRGVCSDPTCTVRPEGADLQPPPSQYGTSPQCRVTDGSHPIQDNRGLVQRPKMTVPPRAEFCSRGRALAPLCLCSAQQGFWPSAGFTSPPCPGPRDSNYDSRPHQPRAMKDSSENSI